MDREEIDAKTRPYSKTGESPPLFARTELFQSCIRSFYGERKAAVSGRRGVGIALLLLIPKWNRLVPGALVVVVLATGASYAFSFEEHGMAVVGSIPKGLPPLSLPDLNLGTLNTLLPAAVTLALVQFMKDVSLGRVFATRHGYTIDANKELVGLGSANLVGSFFSSIPVSGSFSRSAVNDQTGAQTPLANWFTAGVIALTLLFLTPLFYSLPTPALAAIIIVAGIGLIDVHELRNLFKARRRDGYIALFTAGCTLFIGIQEGILSASGPPSSPCSTASAAPTWPSSDTSPAPTSSATWSASGRRCA